MDPKRTIIAIGGGILRTGETLPIDSFIVEQSKKTNPNVLFIPTASSDLPAYSTAFRQTYKKLGCNVQILSLNNKETSQSTLKKIIMSNDIIYVGGGDYETLFSLWKKHNLAPMIKAAYKNGTIITGLSAGCGIWYKYVGIQKNNNIIFKQGIGIISDIVIPHYQSKMQINLEQIPNKIKKIIGIEDNCAVVYIDEKLQGSLSSNDTNAFTISPFHGTNKKINTILYK